MDFKVGQTVWCVINGEGVVHKIAYSERYPVYVRFNNATSATYSVDGKFNQFNKHRSLYFSEPKVEGAEKPVFVSAFTAGEQILVITGYGAAGVINVIGESESTILSNTGVHVPKDAGNKFYRLPSLEQVNFSA